MPPPVVKHLTVTDKRKSKRRTHGELISIYEWVG